MVSSALDAMAGTAWGRWLGLVAAVWVQCVSGNNYTFSNYSDSIKTLMGLTQLQLNGLSVAKDVGKAFGLLAGLASDRVPTWLLLAIGSLEGFLGYGAQWLVVSKTVAPLPYWQICVCLCLGGNSTTWMNTAVLVTCIRNFRGSRGPVSGVLKGFVGLSTAIFTDLCSALFADDPASFLVMLAVVPAAVCALAMVFLRKAANADAENTVLDDSTTTTPLLLASKPAAAEARGPSERPRLGEEHTIAEALSALDFWPVPTLSTAARHFVEHAAGVREGRPAASSPRQSRAGSSRRARGG
ncbi:protein NUCLEAR FUSION DEFECTIVE 4-like [Lolium perenne]|uniref:protein NUCLEAR FUSION DEFECTIVE 4-like n=1 Tax=Lolium perenne TaxID=4522 RepID=UPI003A990DDA